jgi:hypothetical protein
MQLSVSQLQKQHRLLVEALKRGETVELTYHGKLLGIIQPQVGGFDEVSADDFWGMHSDMGLNGVEDVVRQIRKPRAMRRDI